MQLAAITGAEQCEIRDVPDPCVAGEFVKVKLLAVPMCTEYKMYQKGGEHACLGHEAAGEVAEIAGSTLRKVGERVVVMPLSPCGACDLCVRGDYIHCQSNVNTLKACNSPTGVATYAQYCLKQDWLCLPIPDDISMDHASMACCGLGPSFNAMQRMRVDAFDTVLVTGLGPVGLGAVVNGVVRGARVIGVEANEYRADLARQIGAAHVLDPRDPEALAQLRDLTGGKGADKAVDCAGVVPAQRFMVDGVRRRGDVAFVAEASDFTFNVSNDFIRKGITVHGIWHWNLTDTPRMWDTIRKAKDLLDIQITHRLPMSRVKEAWDLQVSGQCGKIILHPWE
jgi:L-iditol 2-dehydrogenase